MLLVYPAIFDPWDDSPGFTVTIPDMPGFTTEGETLADAIVIAQNAAAGWVLDELEDGKPAPVASDIRSIHANRDAFVSMLLLNVEYR